MRFFLLLACCAISLNTSAQFWKKKVRYTQLEHAKFSPLPQFKTPAISLNAKVTYAFLIMPQVFDFDREEQAKLKQAKRNMRYREYQEASHNFTDLAGLYLLHNRFSEAKWYLLQSFSLTHDNKLKLANLLTLAGIKRDLGEITLAKTDLQNARLLAVANGFKTDVADIDQRLLALTNNKPLAVKPVLRYAEAVEAAARKTAALKAL